MIQSWLSFKEKETFPLCKWREEDQLGKAGYGTGQDGRDTFP